MASTFDGPPPGAQTVTLCPLRPRNFAASSARPMAPSAARSASAARPVSAGGASPSASGSGRTQRAVSGEGRASRRQCRAFCARGASGGRGTSPRHDSIRARAGRNPGFRAGATPAGRGRGDVTRQHCSASPRTSPGQPPPRSWAVQRVRRADAHSSRGRARTPGSRPDRGGAASWTGCGRRHPRPSPWWPRRRPEAGLGPAPAAMMWLVDPLDRHARLRGGAGTTFTRQHRPAAGGAPLARVLGRVGDGESSLRRSSAAALRTAATWVAGPRSARGPCRRGAHALPSFHGRGDPRLEAFLADRRWRRGCAGPRWARPTRNSACTLCVWRARAISTPHETASARRLRVGHCVGEALVVAAWRARARLGRRAALLRQAGLAATRASRYALTPRPW
jgi:hypothetical protein